MADAGLKWVFSAVDNVSATMSKIGKETDKLGASHARLNAASRMIGAGAIIAFGAASVKAYAEAEVSQSKLTQAYSRFPAMAKVSIESLRAYNDELEKKTATDADSIAAAQAQLAQFALNGDQIKQLTPLLIDYARATGQDVTSASGALGKALMGNAKALKSIGIDFKATGDRSADLATLMEALQGKVGGAGEAFRKTAAGDMEEFNLQMGNLQEAVGQQLVPALSKLVDIAVPVLETFGKMPEPVKTLVVGIGALGAVALVVAPKIMSMVASSRLMKAAALESAAALAVQGGAATKAGAAAAGGAAGMGKYAGAMKGAGVAAAALSIGLPFVGQLVGSIGEKMFGTTTKADQLGTSLQAIAAGGSSDGIGAFGDKLHSLGAEVEHLANPGVTQRVEDFFGSLAGQGGGEGRNRVIAQINEIDTALANMVRSGHAKDAAAALAKLEADAVAAGAPVGELTGQLDEYAGAVDTAKAGTGDLSTELDYGSGAADSFSGTIKKAATSADILKAAADALQASLDALGGKAMSVDSANSALEASFDDAKSAIAEANKDTDASTDSHNKLRTALDLLTPAGRTAQEKLQAIATAADVVATAQTKAGASTDTIRLSQERARKKFEEAAVAAGLTAEAAKDLAIKYGVIPDAVVTAVKLEREAEALAKLERVRRRLAELERTRYINIEVKAFSFPNLPGVTPGGTGSGANHAAGGYISGPGSGTSDSVPAMLSNGEFVVRASSVQRLGVPFLHSLNRYAEGGLVTSGGAAALTPAQLLAKFVRDTATAIRLEQGLMKLREDMAAQSRDTKNSVKSFASLTNSFDTKAYATAKADVATARARLNSAATPAERTAALADLDQAQAAARNSKPTAGNVIAGLRAKLGVIKSFGKNLRTLAKNGLPSSFLQQLIDAGPEEGGDLAKALLDSSPAQMKELAAIQRTIDRESGRIGNQRAHLEYDPLISRQRGLVNSAVARAGADEVLVSQVSVVLDSREIATALAEYKRSIGGRALGLA